ncbi:hypothetical protein [Jannaschia ovalis]|uniref:TVP38/TMEM64 family membrane protein n=1 Tax=Jannaschia ovalis TaxID=3038773 RepID=A0ABY8LHI0_9RHOB|nr:hypothetical protein [Jannaschia sp. GRR-S6-38]WGH79649.1 hypothetical protein P8627_05135 [Jannaschia sp. GRR-S6-38]
MSAPSPTAPGPGPIGILLRLAALLAVIVAATWASHLLREALDLQITPETEQQVHRMIMLGTLAYILLLAIPFVPGAEIGIAMITAFGAAIAPLVWLATVLALLLSFGIGYMLPVTMLARLFRVLHLRRAAAIVERAAPLSRPARLEMLLADMPPRFVALALRHRYVALALAVNTPGNALIGGGGGIALMAGLSGLFAPLPTAIAIALAVSPVPLAVMLLGV